MNSERKTRQFRSMTPAVAAGRILATSVFALALASFSAGQTPPVPQLKFSQNVKLLNCEPASNVPCFRVGFSALAPSGRRALLPALTPPELASTLTIDVNQRTVKPFFASFLAGTYHPPPSRLALFLVDTSGSMNKRLPNGETRFEAAKAAISYFLEGFENGVDRVAVVGFESHGVAATIRSARFAIARADAQSEVDALAAPKPRNDTALYSALDIGLDTLEEQIKKSPGTTRAFLYLLTDGDNDVHASRGDDRDLLQGPAGLQIVAQKVQDDSSIQVVAVGIGDPQEVNQDALSQISRKFEMITDANGLRQAFKHPNPSVQASDIVATFISPWPDRASLAARTINLRVQMKLPSGEELESNKTGWAAPEIGPPLFAGKSDAKEGEALLQSSFAGRSSPWMSALRPILVFAGLGAVLLILWFWVPRLIWADEYAGMIPQTDRLRWGEASIAQRASPPGARPAPAGFEQGRGGGRGTPRAPSDATIMAPGNLMGTRTRLEISPSPERDRRK